MARHQVMLCDICGQPTEQIVGKISFCPTIRGVVRLNWNNYTHTADVGVCCKDQLFTDINFRKRMSQKQYQESRKAKANHTTVRATRKKAEPSDA